jgi:hypothetical protein
VDAMPVLTAAFSFFKRRASRRASCSGVGLKDIDQKNKTAGNFEIRILLRMLCFMSCACNAVTRVPPPSYLHPVALG